MKINGEVCLPISVVCTGCLSPCRLLLVAVAVAVAAAAAAVCSLASVGPCGGFFHGFGFMVSVFLGSMLVDFGLHLGCWLAGSTS